MEKAGHINEPREDLRPKGKKWGKGYAYVDRAVDKSSWFDFEGKTYRCKYYDGCFLPFVVLES
jgi:hypothetical protein